MNYIDLLTGAGKQDSIFYCHITTADHSHYSVLKKSSVTGSTIGNTHTTKFFLSRNSQLTVSCTTGKNHCSGFIFMLLCMDDFEFSLIFDKKHRLSSGADTSFLCMSYHSLSQLQAADSRKSWIIVHFVCVYDLTALNKFLLQPDCFHFSSCCINSCTYSCRSCSQNGKIVYLF